MPSMPLSRDLSSRDNLKTATDPSEMEELGSVITVSQAIAFDKQAPIP